MSSAESERRSVGASPSSGRGPNIGAGVRVLGPIVVFDIVGPIIVQSQVRHHGASIAGALAISGILLLGRWVLMSMLWRRRVDSVGLFVLTSIALATVIGLATGNGKLYLLDGAILTGVFGLVCLASLAAPRPVMFQFALESNGGDESERGKEFAALWRYPEFRHVFVAMTVVWGLGFVLQAAINIAIIEATSTNKAFFINKILPYIFLAGLGASTFLYGMRSKRRGQARHDATPID